MCPDPQESRRRQNLDLAEASSLGIMFAASVLIGLGLGVLVDRWFAADPWGLFIGTGMGFAAGCLNLARLARRIMKRWKREEENDGA